MSERIEATDFNAKEILNAEPFSLEESGFSEYRSDKSIILYVKKYLASYGIDCSDVAAEKMSIIFDDIIFVTKRHYVEKSKKGGVV